MSHHFKMGFIRAYEDLALNQRPSPPIVPPPKYWNAYYRSCAGRPCVDDWFAGYDAGLGMGSNSGVSRFHEIYLRRNGCGLPNSNGYSQSANYGYEFDGGHPTPMPTPQEMPVPTPNSYNVYGTATPYRF